MQKGVFLGKHQNMEFVEFELRNYWNYCQPSSVVIESFAEIVVKYEMKPDQDDICINSSCQDVYYSNVIIFQILLKK